MAKEKFFSDSTANLFDDPIGFLKTFIMLAVPTSVMIWILLIGTYAENTGHGVIGQFLLSFYNLIDKITLFLFETFIDLVVYAVVIVIIVTSILTAFGIKR